MFSSLHRIELMHDLYNMVLCFCDFCVVSIVLLLASLHHIFHVLASWNTRTENNPKNCLTSTKISRCIFCPQEFKQTASLQRTSLTVPLGSNPGTATSIELDFNSRRLRENFDQMRDAGDLPTYFLTFATCSSCKIL